MNNFNGNHYLLLIEEVIEILPAYMVCVFLAGKASHIDGEHIPVLALALLLTISILALVVVGVMWIRRRNRTPFPIMLLQRRQSDERPITMSLTNNDTLVENGTTADEFRTS